MPLKQLQLVTSGVGGGMRHSSSIPLLADKKNRRVLGTRCQYFVQAWSTAGKIYEVSGHADSGFRPGSKLF